MGRRAGWPRRRPSRRRCDGLIRFGRSGRRGWAPFEVSAPGAAAQLQSCTRCRAWLRRREPTRRREERESEARRWGDDGRPPRLPGSAVCAAARGDAGQHGGRDRPMDLKEKKEVVEEAENGRDAPANGNANEENGEQEADNEVDEEEEEGGEEEEEEEEGDGEEEDGDEDEEAESATGKRAAEDDEDDDVDTKKQKTDEDD
ncbi:prothymosin alpha isoform X1 [Pan paniscus]